MHYFPIALPILLLLLLVIGFVIVLIEVGVLRYAYDRIGIDRRYVYTIILLSFLGSYVNIPLYRLPGESVVSGSKVFFYGVPYVVPFVENWPGTLIAVNVGGAVIPTILSIYLIIKNRIWLQAVLGIAAVTVLVHALAHPVRGVGIAEPIFAPPLFAAAVSLLLSRQRAPALAYVSGSLGTLLGADILNLDKVRGLGAPVAAIGGAGTFDGILLTGVLAVVMASLFTPRARPRSI